MRKIVVASDSFKGTISSREIADIYENIVKEQGLDISITKVPLADGGENTLEVFSSHFKNGEYHYLEVTGPSFNKVNAKYFSYDDIAVIELAQAAGLPLVIEKNAKQTTTYGVGELILDAYNKGYKKFYIALGGSASTDGGCGLLSALGIKFFNKANQEFIPVGETLSDIKNIDVDGLRVKDAHFTILSDVKNPMFGEKGASYIFAKQKGATPEDVELLDTNLRYLNQLFVKHTGKHVEDIEGAGAAGAAAAGILAFLNAEIVSGINTILAIIDFKSIIKDAEFVITGEGRLDYQSFDGKLISGVLSVTKEMDIPTICVCGASRINPEDETGFCAIYQTSPGEGLDYKKHAREFYISTASTLLKDI